MLEEIKKSLGANYKEDDEDVLIDILEEVTSIASNISNRNEQDKMLKPYIFKTAKAIYLNRGSEGLKSLNESGVSSTFEDNIEILRNNIIKNGIRRLK